MSGITEDHESEQYFFDRATLDGLTELISAFERPCLLCAPMLGRHLHLQGRDVRVLDVDKRFADLPGFVEWDIYRPRHLDESFDLILADPPFFKVSLSKLFKAVRMLAGFDFSQKLAITYLARRASAIVGTFRPFGLKATGIRITYQSVTATGRNDIRLFTNSTYLRLNGEIILPHSTSNGMCAKRRPIGLVGYRTSPSQARDGFQPGGMNFRGHILYADQQVYQNQFICACHQASSLRLARMYSSRDHIPFHQREGTHYPFEESRGTVCNNQCKTPNLHLLCEHQNLNLSSRYNTRTSSG